jgi:hypothetical protein
MNVVKGLCYRILTLWRGARQCLLELSFRSPIMKLWSFSLLLLCLAGTAPSARAVDCLNNIPRINPDTVYQLHGNGTATDTRSGLLWKRCSEGQNWTGSDCNGTPSTHTWSQALSLAEASTFAGYSDWRIPNMPELTSLVEECRISPAINSIVFPSTPSLPFWSGSPLADDWSSAWSVDFDDGEENPYTGRGQAMHVRLVRGGQ